MEVRVTQWKNENKMAAPTITTIVPTKPMNSANNTNADRLRE